jgi:hypothetical protein
MQSVVKQVAGVRAEMGGWILYLLVCMLCCMSLYVLLLSPAGNCPSPRILPN